MSSKDYKKSGYNLDLDLLTIFTNCVVRSYEKKDSCHQKQPFKTHLPYVKLEALTVYKDLVRIIKKQR